MKLDDAKDPRQDVFMRLAAGIGDLRNPFHREERQRDVWNQASAVTSQVLVRGGLLAAFVLPAFFLAGVAHATAGLGTGSTS